jgi:hypothetical protein
MFEELRDTLKVVLLVNVSDNVMDKIQKGNPTTIIISFDTGAQIHEDLSSETGFRTVYDFELVKNRVDLIIFGAPVSGLAAQMLISRFAQRDVLLLFEADADSISFGDLAATGAVDARVFSLHRLPGVLVVGYEPGADFGTRTYAKLLSEFLCPLGRIVSGARVVVDGPFAKPSLAGNWFLIARSGASFRACRLLGGRESRRGRPLQVGDYLACDGRVLVSAARWPL